MIGGIVGGLLLSLLSSKLLAQWAEGSAQNPMVIAGVIVLLGATSSIAAWIPARRASAVDPMVALRYE
jgi:ABC-type antimicrobial peptide transport system permease subunit